MLGGGRARSRVSDTPLWRGPLLCLPLSVPLPPPFKAEQADQDQETFTGRKSLEREEYALIPKKRSIILAYGHPRYPWGIGFRTPTEYQNSKMLKSLVCKTVFYLHIIFYIFSCVLYIISRLLMIPNTMKSMANSSFVLEASGIFFFLSTVG